ncbi:MAG: HEPN domain-containing protein [Deltaproteobacteria bacterium]|nr:HEPN domain-containing protein [Deltaproteobacteria bacterium]
MHDPRRVSEAFLIESGADFQSARVLFRSGCFARSIYLCQQCVEKAVKASLGLKGIFTTDHSLSPMFSALYSSAFKDMDRLVVAIQSLERLGARARFPLFQRDDLPVWIPSREFGKKEAASALTHCEFVYQNLKEHLVTVEGLEPFAEELG